MQRSEDDTDARVDEYVRLAGLIPQESHASPNRCGECASGENVFVRPSYESDAWAEYALCNACMRHRAAKVVCYITIVRLDEAVAPDMPSHLFPGCESDGAEFTITHGRKPTRADLSGMLYEAVIDGMVVEYDETTGRGYFGVVDGGAPPAGTVIPLITPADCNLAE